VDSVVAVEPAAVRLATERDRDRVVATVTAAFAQEPAFQFFFPGPDAYAEEAPLFVGHLFDVRCTFGSVWVVDDGSAVSMWNPPGGTSGGLPAGVSARARDRMREYDAAVHAVLPQTPHWYLGVLATDPAHSGQRWGRLAMAQGLELAQRDGLPAYLETTTETNVGIYSRSGWRIVDSVAVDTFQVRIMVNAAV
jgi:ribosomal protein S18 acetylase RimI-like enzyme